MFVFFSIAVFYYAPLVVLRRIKLFWSDWKFWRFDRRFVYYRHVWQRNDQRKYNNFGARREN